MLIVVILLATLALAGPLVGVIFGLISVDFVLSSLNLSFSVSQYLVLGTVLCAVPLAGYMAGTIVQPLLGERQSTRVFSVLGATLALALATRGDRVASYLDSVIGMIRGESLAHQIVLFGACAQAIVLCGGLIGASLLLMVIVFELPIWWVQGVARGKIDLALLGFRPVLVLFALSLILHAAVSLCAFQMAPSNLLSSAGL